MRKVFIEHITHYMYPNSVSYHSNQIMLYPRVNEFQELNSQLLQITTHPQIFTHKDFFGNKIGTFNIIESHDTLTISSLVEITMNSKPIPTIDEDPKLQWNNIDLLKKKISFFEYFSQTDYYPSGNLSTILPYDYTTTPPLEVCVALSEFVYQNFAYRQGITSVSSSLAEIWKLKAGVCQDFTNVLLHLNRFFGIPSRYVSGYICPTENSNFRGVGATHAWVEVFIPKMGWIGLDPTNNCVTNENYVILAIGRQFKDCSPVKGVYSGDSIDLLDVSVKISDKNHFNSNKTHNSPSNFTQNKAQNPLNSFAKHQEILIQQQQQQQ